MKNPFMTSCKLGFYYESIWLKTVTSYRHNTLRNTVRPAGTSKVTRNNRPITQCIKEYRYTAYPEITVEHKTVKRKHQRRITQRKKNPIMISNTQSKTHIIQHP
jgi:hypothetical protein